CTLTLYLALYSAPIHQSLLSFPTRRSSDLDQAADRAHRFGQKNVVQVIRLITEGTIEEKIYDLQQKKRELIDKDVQPGETMLSRDRKSTRLNSSHVSISYAVFCLKKKTS